MKENIFSLPACSYDRWLRHLQESGKAAASGLEGLSKFSSTYTKLAFAFANLLRLLQTKKE